MRSEKDEKIVSLEFQSLPNQGSGYDTITQPRVIITGDELSPDPCLEFF